MTPAEFIRTSITGPGASCQVDLDGIGEAHARGGAVFLIIDAERANGWFGHAAVSTIHHDARVRLVHAISRWAGGEIRGWIWHEDTLHLRYPSSPEDWPELDALVEQATGASVRKATRPA